MKSHHDAHKPTASFAAACIAFAALALGGCAAEVQADDAAASVAEAEVAPTELAPVPAAHFCPTSGRVETLGANALKVNVGGMRGIVAGDNSHTAEVEFVYRGSSQDIAPLANGELRREIGLKLRAQDTCNVVYVTWHVEPTPGVFVSVKHNPGKATHAECGADGYINLQPHTSEHVAAIRPGDKHTLRATIEGDVLRVLADGKLAWEGTLPPEAATFDGPAGTRTDNGEFDFTLKVPGGARRPAACPSDPHAMVD